MIGARGGFGPLALPALMMTSGAGSSISRSSSRRNRLLRVRRVTFWALGSGLARMAWAASWRSRLPARSSGDRRRMSLAAASAAS